jgi:hypothetical protein
MNRSALSVAALVTGVLIGAASLFAGPLNPPPGPVTSTYKTLSQVEPRTPISALSSGSVTGFPCDYLITQSGSYYLDRNLSSTIGGNLAIGVAASNVTIDLNGFTIEGNNTGVTGIGTGTGAPSNIVVRNGTVRNFGGAGVDLTNASFVVVENVNVSLPNNVIAARCIAAAANARISRCVVQKGITGIIVGARATIDACTIIGSGTGVSADVNSTLTQVSVQSTSGVGVSLGASSSATDCHTSGSGGSGYVLADYCQLINCTADGPGSASSPGIDTGAASYAVLRNCRASGFLGTAYVLGAGADVTGCTASHCEGSGIVASGGSATIDACKVTGVLGNGIELSNQCTVTNSQVNIIGWYYRDGSPATSGVVVSGGFLNRIEGNVFRSCPSSVTLTSGSNKNECYRNSAYFYASGGYIDNSGNSNYFGPIRIDSVPTGPWDNALLN